MYVLCIGCGGEGGGGMSYILLYLTLFWYIQYLSAELEDPALWSSK